MSKKSFAFFVALLVCANVYIFSRQEKGGPGSPGERLLPLGGVDQLNSLGTILLDLNCSGTPGPQVDLRGPTVIRRSDPAGGTIDTQMTSMDLTGLGSFGPVIVRLNPERPSTGKITELRPGQGFPANSFFDVFFEIEIPGSGTVVNTEPVKMGTTIYEIPPRLTKYNSLTSAPIPLKLKGTDRVIACLIHASHTPNPPTTVRTEDLKILTERAILGVDLISSKLDLLLKTQRVGPTSVLMFVFNVTGGGLETGLAITNITRGLKLLGLGEDTNGAIEFRLLPSAPGASAISVSSADLVKKGLGAGASSDGVIGAGGTFTILVSQLLAAAGVSGGFTGQIFAICGFPAEGVNFIADSAFQNQAQGYPAIHIR